MGVTVVNKNYSTRNFAGGNNFALANATQFVTDTIDIVEDYDFESSMQNQVLIVSEFTMQVLNASWTEKGLSIGDAIELSGTIQNGGSTTVYTSLATNIIDIQGDLLTIDTSLGIAPTPPQTTSYVVGQMMPAPSGATSNTTLVIVNTTVVASQSIEVFHNLVQNNAQGSDLSLFDGEVNRFRADSLIALAVAGTINMTQMGFQSGGTYKSVILTRLADVNSKRSYEIEFIYANPYKFADSDFDEPSQYSGSASLKPYYRFLCLPVSNNPNSFLELTHAVQMGNLGWYGENYNQGINTFVVESVTITDVSLNQLTVPDYSQTNIITVVISGDDTFLEKVEGEFYLIPPSNTVKEQPNSNGDNISLSNFFYDTTGAPIIEIDVFGNNLATIPSLSHSIVLGVNEITISFRLNPTAGFETLLDGMNSNERLYRIALNVESHGGTANENNAVSLIVSEGIMEKAPLVGGDFTGLRLKRYYPHNSDIGGAGTFPYSGNPEDDLLFFANIDFEKDETWLSATLDVRITRDSDGAFFILEDRFIPFGSYVTTPDGVQQIQFLQTIQQFLDSPNRNKVSMSVNGNDTPTTYELDITWSLMINWREWIPKSNAFIDFYDNTLQNNGLNNEWMRYLRVAGYTLSTEVTLLDEANTAFRFGADIELVDYDVTPDITTTVLYYDASNNATTAFVEGETNRIEATHVNNLINWDQDNTWGWNSIRPFEGEPNKRISTVWPWTSQNLPLKPLTGETTARLTFPALNIAVVDCDVDTNLLESDISSIIVKIDDTKGNYNVHKEEINRVRLPTVATDTDRGAQHCKTPIRAFATLDNADLDKNSRLGLAYKFDSFTVTLIRKRDGVEILAPGIAVSFPYQSDASGFVIDWRQVTRNGGTEIDQGCYRVRVDWVNSIRSGFFYECDIELLEYNNLNTEGYVNLFVVLNDAVTNDGITINYKDSGFATTIAFKGIFGYMQPNYLTTNNVYAPDNTRGKVRILPVRTYELRTDYLLSCATQQIDERYLLAANQIYITDWNVTNHVQERYTNFPIILTEEESPSFEYDTSVYAKVTAVFKDRQQLQESKYDGNIKGSDNIILQLPIIIGVPTSCLPATVENSDQTYQQSVVSGATLVLPDVTFDVYVNAVLDSSVTVPSIQDTTINITP